ncbi:hypothetical protein BDY24DRAFT_343675 [Mrakia frigida]|uniref:uncharacterized protein n=1 Tax=Mrakia frigida TaxID=29902 RepID=UPI003FCBF93A
MANRSESDPLLLRSRVMHDEGLEALRKRKTAGGGGFFKRDSKKKEVVGFYETQNEHIDNLLKPMDVHSSEAAELEAASSKKVKLAVQLSFIANCVLAVLQIYAAASSLSLSLFATAADSIFDPFANWILNVAHKKGLTADPLKWPQGGARFETIGNVVYAFLMGAVNMILIVESIRTIVTHNGEEETTKLNWPSLVAVGIAFLTKFALFLFCWGIKDQSTQVQVLWEDHRNDLLINGFGILTSAGGSKLKWWLDPAGAIIIATVIITSWTRTCHEQLLLLAGRAADPAFNNVVVYKAMTFSPLITAIDSCKIYSNGSDFICELDVVMDGKTLLSTAHDISQALQDALELMPGIDRAFVHVDHEVTHAPEHRKTR